MRRVEVVYVSLADLPNEECRRPRAHAIEIRAFIERAISKEVRLFPEQVEEYVRRHRADVHTEECWRHLFNAKLNELQLSMHFWQMAHSAPKGEDLAAMMTMLHNLQTEVTVLNGTPQLEKKEKERVYVNAMESRIDAKLEALTSLIQSGSLVGAVAMDVRMVSEEPAGSMEEADSLPGGSYIDGQASSSERKLSI